VSLPRRQRDLVLRTANCSPVDHLEFVALRALKLVVDFCRPVLGGWLLLVLLWCSACTGAREPLEKPQHYFGGTELDIEYGRPQAASVYHRPRGVQHYRFDGTEVDLAVPLAPLPQKKRPSIPPVSPGSPSADR
jgi:hypothetical protein